MSQRILIVDDEVYIRLLLEQTLEDLEDEGVEILTATNGREALQMIGAHHPKLVFLDVMMPQMNGFDVCQSVRGYASLAEVRIVMLTAKGQELDRQRAMALGADAYITKPFDPVELVAVARKYLEM